MLSGSSGGRLRPRRKSRVQPPFGLARGSVLTGGPHRHPDHGPVVAHPHLDEQRHHGPVAASRCTRGGRGAGGSEVVVVKGDPPSQHTAGRHQRAGHTDGEPVAMVTAQVRPARNATAACSAARSDTPVRCSTRPSGATTAENPVGAAACSTHLPVSIARNRLEATCWDWTWVPVKLDPLVGFSSTADVALVADPAALPELR